MSTDSWIELQIALSMNNEVRVDSSMYRENISWIEGQKAQGF